MLESTLHRGLVAVTQCFSEAFSRCIRGVISTSFICR